MSVSVVAGPGFEPTGDTRVKETSGAELHGRCRWLILSRRATSLPCRRAARASSSYTESLLRWLSAIAAEDGLLTVFIRHTSASLTVQENADPKVRVDLLAALDDLAPEHRAYTHAEEGPDDMPSHIKAMLTSVSLSIPVKEGRMLLGPWQGVYVSSTAPSRTSGRSRSASLATLPRRKVGRHA